MEPRILLSAAPIDAPLGGADVSAVPDIQVSFDQSVQQSFVTTSDEISSLNDDEGDLFGETTELPGAEPETIADPDTEDDSLTDVDPLVEEDAFSQEQSALIQIDNASTVSSDNNFATFDEEVTLVPEKPVIDSVATELVTTLNAANGPPMAGDTTTSIDSLTSSTSTSTPGLQNEVAGTNNEYSLTDGDLSSDESQDLLITYPNALAGDHTNGSGDHLLFDGDSTLGTVSSDELTQEQIDELLQVAISLWANALPDADIANLTQGITARVANLDGGILGEAIGQSITLDATAAGRGWFVDTTPYDHSEFESVDGQLTAIAGSDASGRIDLLTVLTHEVGHVLGYGHDSGLAIMEDSLGAGERTLLSGAVPAGGTVPVRGAYTFAGGTITGQVGDPNLIFRIFDNQAGANSILDVQVINATTSAVLATYNDVSTINALLPGLNDTIRVDLDLDTTWTLSGLGSGSVSVDGWSSIAFTGIERLIGAETARDTFIIDGGIVAGSINGRGGVEEITLDGFLNLAGANLSFSISSSLLTVSGRATVDLGGLLTAEGSFTLAQFNVTSATLLGSAATGVALQLQVSGGIPSGGVSGAGSLQMLRLTNATHQTWLGIEATGLSFSLDYAPLTLSVTNGTFAYNEAPAGQAKLNWSSVPTRNAIGSSFNLSLNAAVDFSVSGYAVVDIDGLVTVSGNFSLEQFDVASNTLLGSAATGLALQLQISAGIPTGGVSGSGTLQMLRLTNATNQTWLGIEATDLSFSLDYNPLTFAVTNGTLALNQAATGETKLDWSDATIQADIGSPFDLTVVDTVDFSVSGYAVIDIDGLLSVSGNFSLEQFDVVSSTLLNSAATGLALQLQVRAGIPSGGVTGSGTLQMLRLTNATGQTWLGVEATSLAFGLELAPLTLSVTNGTLSLNQAPDGETKLDWSDSATQADIGSPFDLSLTDTLSFSVSGNAVIDIDGLVTVSGNFALTQFDANSSTLLGSAATGLALQLQVSAGIPSGGVSSSGTLQMLRLTNATGQTWLGIEATALEFGLEFAPLSLSVTNGALALNFAPDGETKLDWSNATTQADIGSPFDLSLTDTVNFSVSGNAVIDVDGLLTVSGSFALSQFDVASSALLGSAATGLALQLQVSAGIPSGGVSGSGTLQMIRLTNATNQTWLGLEATDLEFGLEFAPLTLAVTNGTLTLNQAADGEAKLDWSDAATRTAIGSPFDLSVSDTVNFSVSGNAVIDVDGLLTVSGSFALSQFDVVSSTLLGSAATGLALQLQVSAGIPSGGVSGSGTLQMLRLTNAAGQTWLGVEATDMEFGLEFSPLSLSVTNGTLSLNQAPEGETKLDWSDAATQADIGSPFDLSISDAVNFSVSGNAVIDIDGLLTVSGNFALTQFDVASSTLLDSAATGLALQLQISAGIPSGGVSGSGTLQMLRLTNATGQTWVGIEATALAFSMEFGPLDLAVTNGTVSINQAPDGETKLNWSNAATRTAIGSPFNLSMTNTVNFSVSGTVTFEFGGLVSVAATFALAQQSGGIGIIDPDDTLKTMTGNLLILSLTNAHFFAGVGGTLSGGALTVASDAVGFEVSGVSVSLAVFDAEDGRSFTGLQTNFSTITIHGLTDFGFDATISNLRIDYNGTSVEGGKRIDWRAVSSTGLTLTSQDQIRVSGSLIIGISDFVQVRGSFALTKSSDVEMYVAGSSTPTSFSVITIGFEDVDVFVGDGPYFTGPTTTNANAVGLLLQDIDIAIALFDPTNTSDTSSYYAISARAESIQILGLDFSAGSSSFSASGYRVEINGGKNSSGNPSALDFTKLEDGKFTVPTGVGSVDFDYSSRLLRLAIENAVLMIDDFVYISGGFSLTQQKNYTLTLSNNTTVTVDVLVFGGGDVDLFIGDGPYFEDTNGDGIIDYSDDRNPDALGLVVESANFGLVMMKPSTGTGSKYTSLKITADYVGFVGLDEFRFSATGISLEYNAATGATPNVVAKFSTTPYVVDTGNGTLSLDFGTKLLRASTTGVELQISDYVFVRGSLAFEKGPASTVTLSGSGGTRSVTTLKVGAENVTMFFGANGPYWTDFNNDNVIDASETSDRAIGVQVSNASLAMALMKPVSGSATKYIGLKATASSIGFVGVDAFQLSGSNIFVNLNIATGGGATAATPVVDFSTFSAEALAVFDANNNGITVAELRALSGQTRYTTANGELYSASAAAADGVDLDLIVSILDLDGDGALSVTEVQAFVTNDPAVTAADVNGNGRIDIGMEIATGTGYIYLDEPGRRIFASADDVLINVSEFLYVNGSIAIDLGARETVTINTGIPSALADLIPASTIADINAALTNFSTTLTDLETDILTAFDTVVAELKTAIDTAVANAVATIKAQLAQLANTVKSNVESAMSSALNTQATSSVTALFSNIIDPVIDTLADLVSLSNPTMSTAVKTFLQGLLEPVKNMLAAAFDTILDEVLTKVVNRIGGAVIGAIDNAVDKVGTAIDDAIRDKVNPQLARIYAEMDKLNEKLQGAISPVFAKLQNIANIQISEGADQFSQLTGVEVEVTAIGVSNATAFVGLPPAGGFNMSLPLADQYGASGLLIENLTFGIAMFKPVENKVLPTFYAGKITATTAQFRVGDGDNDPTNDFMRIIAQGIVVEFNLGGPIVKGTGSLLGNATIDFVASFPDTDSGGPDQIGFEVQTGTTTPPVLLDFDYEYMLASIARATIQISEFIYISASIAIEKGPAQTFDVAPGLLPINDLAAIAGLLGINVSALPVVNSIPAVGATSTEVSVITFGASNVHAFVGMGGPYWSYERDAVINGGDGDGQIDANEINSRAVGIVINDFDFGMAIMKPTLAIDPSKYFALSASARNISLVGMPGVTLTADHLLVQVNMSSPSVYGNSLLPVIDFAGTAAFAVNEQQGLFDILDTDGNNQISLAEMNTAFGTNHSATAVISTVAQLVLTLDVGGAPPVAGQPVPDGKLSLGEVLDILETAFETTHGAAILALDADGDGKFDPPGFEVNTGGQPVYLTMDSSLILAQGFVQIDLFGAVILTGSVAFELGPRQNVTLTDGSTKSVTTMTIGAANVTAFIGINGPYWTDTGDHIVQPGELSSTARGFHITDFDMGIMVMASTALSDVGAYLAASATVNSFGLVNLPYVDAQGQFDIKINVGFGLASGAAVVDLQASFPEEFAAYYDDVANGGNGDGVIQASEMPASVRTALGVTGATEVTMVDLFEYYDAVANGGNADGILSVTEVAALANADLDGDGKLDLAGFEVNTGDPTSPVLLNFTDEIISVQLAGSLTISTDAAKTNDVFKFTGLFLFEKTSTTLSAFVLATLEVGPDIGAATSSKLFDIKALGGLVITSTGIAADIDLSVSVGGALSSVVRFAGSARVLFNTTGTNQTITIPERYVGFLDGTVNIETSFPGSGFTNPAALTTLTGTLDSRFTANPNGSVTFTISGAAPRLDGTFDPAGAYFFVSLSGDLTIARTFTITAAFQLKLSTTGLELGMNGTIDLGGFLTLNVTGGAVIENGVFAAYLSVAVDFDPVAGLNISGDAVLEINSGGTSKTVYDALGTGHLIAANTYQVTVTAAIDFFGVLSATGSVYIGVSNGTFSISLDATLDFFGILDVGIAGSFSISESGTVRFTITGTLSLDLTVGSGATRFGINGNISITLRESGVSGSGSLGIVVFGESFNVAAGRVSVNWQTGAWSIYAEGPLSIWIEVTSTGYGDYDIDGGLGVLSAVIEALGDAIVAVGEAVTVAALAVAEAFEDLASAILDFGADVIDFVDGLITDFVNLLSDIGDEISSWFESSKTEIVDLTGSIVPANYFTYTTSLVGGVLTVTNNSSINLRFAIVNGNLIIDAPDTTQSVLVARSDYYTRYFRWKGPIPWGWSGWSLQSSTSHYRDITFSNMTSIASAGITQINVVGANIAETIVMDGNSISINTNVSGNGGDDLIVTGGGNDVVNGGDGDDTVFTYGGNDQLSGGSGNDNLFGGIGNDTYSGGGGDDLLDENKDRATPNVTISETNTMTGDAGADIILGSPGVDTIQGGSGNDILVGLYHNDEYDFLNGYGTDKFTDFYGEVTLNFGGHADALNVTKASTGWSASATTGNLLAVDPLETVAFLNLGTASDTVNISALPNYLITITGGTGTDVITVDDSADLIGKTGALTSTRLTGLGMGDATKGIEYSGIEDLRILLGSGNDTFTINSTHSGTPAKSTTLNSGAGDDTILINGASDTLVVNGLAGADTFNVRTTGAASAVTLNGGADADTFNIGSLAPGAGGVLTGISGVLTVNGDSTGTNSDVLNVDVTGAATGQTGTITTTTISGFGMLGSIAYGTLEGINVNLSPGDDIFNIRGIGAPTIVSGGFGSDRFNVGSLAPASSGVLTGILALLTIEGGSTGSNNDVMVVDVTGAIAGLIGAMTGTTITGLGMTGSIAYSNLESLDIDLGSGGDNFTVNSSSILTVIHGWGGNETITVQSTGAELTVYGDAGADAITINDSGAVLTVNGGDDADTITVNDTGAAVTLNGDAGNDLITIVGVSATFTINGGADDDVINVRASAVSSIINTGTGVNTVNIGSTDWGTDGNVNAVLGALTINGGGTDTVRVNDRAEIAASTLVLTDSLLTGLGLVGNEIAGIATSGISYSSIENLIIHSGAGLTQANIRSTHAVTTTTIRSRGTGAVFNVGSLAPAIGGTVNAILGRLVVEAFGANETLNVDDTGDATANIGMLSATRITGFGMGDPDDGIEYAGVEALNLNLGSGGNTVYIIGSHSNTTVVNTGAGTGLVNRVYVGSIYNTVWTSASLEDIAGSLTINGQATNNEIAFDNGDDTAAGAGVLTSTTFAHTAMSGNAALTNAVNYNSFDVINVTLGDGNDNFYVASTPNRSTTTIRSGDETAVGTAINDVVNVNTIGGDFIFIGGTGNDIIRINYDSAGLQTFNNGIANGASVTLRGGNGSDLYEIGLSGTGSAVIDVIDSGDGSDVVNVFGTYYSDVFVLELFAVSSYEVVTNGSGNLEYAANGNFQKVDFDGDVEELNVHGLGADDFFNVRATSVLTNLEGEGGNDAFFVSSAADYTTATAVNVPTGNLNGIQAVLNIDGGTGVQTLKISDADATVADTNVWITDTRPGGSAVGLAPDREITITGLAPAAISYRADASGNYAGGVVIASGSGDDVILIDGTHWRAGGATVTNLYTGYGSDRVTVNLDAAADGTLVLDTEGPYSNNPSATDNDLVNAIGSSLALTIRTGQGDDLIVGGSGDDLIDSGIGYDIIFGSNGADTIHAGLDSGPDVVVGDSGYITFISGGLTYTIYSESADFAAAAWIAFLTRTSFTEIGTSNTGVGGNDIITSGNGSNVVLGGFGADQITGGNDRDVVLGDNGAATFNASGILIGITSTAPTIGGVDIIDVGVGDNTVIGGIGGDQITGGAGRDVVIGDNGSATFDATGVLISIATSDATLAGSYNDVIITGNGFNTVLGGNGTDSITGGDDTDVVLGDNGSATFVNVGGVSLLTGIDSTDAAIGGDDIISVGSGRNSIIGGFGADQITGGANEDVVIGDNGQASFNLSGILISITTIDPTIGGVDVIQVGNGYNVVIGGFGGDQITGGDDRDVVVGDNGSTTFSATGILLAIGTLDPTIGGVDTINTGAGDNTVLGGIGGDQITGGDGRDVVIGDNGSATFDATGVLTNITTSDAGLAGAYDDVILTGGGFNTVLGGNGADTITGGAGTDVVLGDNGSATFVNASGVSLLTNIISTDEAIGGDDLISVGSGYNAIIGGFGADQITGGSDQDVVIGDSGEAIFNLAGYLTSITTIFPAIGGVDTIQVGDGYNVVIGGFGGDQITGGADRDVVVGDNGSTTFSATGILLTIGTLDPTIGGVDTISTGAGDNTVLGGIGGDQITGGDGRDVVIGDNGSATFDTTGVLTFITTSDAGLAGAYDDVILTGGGFNSVLGGNGADTITGAAGNDVILGDNGSATFVNVSGVSLLANIISTDEAIGGDDLISVGNGFNAVIGGFGADQITGGSDQDVVIGDNGEAIFNLAAYLTSITTIFPAIGGVDIIQVGDGYNVVIGGFGGDQITGGADRDVVVGDNGSTTFSATGILLTIGTLDPTIGGVDTISTGAGDNTVLGGIGGDQITGGDGRDVVIGDNGSATFDTTGVLTFITTSDAGLAGAYDDVILTGGGFNTVLGGNGADTITGGAGNDVILGDNGSATFANVSGVSLLTQVTSADETIGGDDLISVANGFNTVIGGFGADQITGGDDQDVIIGDNGVANFSLSGILTTITTTFPSIGGVDVIYTGLGDNAVLGGFGGDLITGGDGRDVVVGDNGNATFNTSGVLIDITTSDPTIGGVDIIQVGNGFNTVLGGIGGDQITGGNDRDVVIGDNGNAQFNGSGVLVTITTTDSAIGDADLIFVGDGDNVALGGFGADQITGGADGDVVVGDNGQAIFTDTGILAFITTLAPTIGGADIILVGDGDNAILGGIGGDQITGGNDRDVVIGDNGNMTFDTTGVLIGLLTSDASLPGAYDDVILTGNGFNTVLAGNGADQVTGGSDRDVVLGDNGSADFINASGVSLLQLIVSTDDAIGGNDIISVGNGRNTVIGGFGADQVTGGLNEDVVVGDNGRAEFNTAGILTYITTTSPAIGGVDVILVSDGENTVLGGFGGDQITGGVDRDVVVGDNGNATFTDAGVLTFITTSEPAIGGDDVILAGSGDNTVLGGIGADEITGGNGRDVVIGDNGNATFDMTGVLLLARTSDPTVPGSYNDVIFTGNGFNTVLAGNGNDRVTGGNGRDVVIGDNGVATFDNVAGISLLREILSTDTAIGGDDTIAAGDGRNVMIGGFGKDLMTSGVDDDIAVGDNGHAFFSVGGVMTYITTISPEIGDIDTIDVSDGDNTVIGGFQGDFITSGSGRDVILGDNGNATFNDNDVLTYITTTEPSIGGVDVIDAGDGDNVVIGGQTGDIINSGNGRDVVIGDNGYAEFNAAARLTFVTTTDPAIGGDDLINAGDGDNVVLAGFGADEVTTGLHDDIVVGDNGYAIFNSSGILTYVTTTEPEIGGDDLIDAGDGRNIVLAGYGSDRVTSGSGQDVVVGDNGYAVFDDSGPLTFITTTSPEIGGDDAIETGAEEDIVFGGQGADTIGSGAGADLVLGDNGYAEFDASGSPTFITTTDFGIGGNDLVFAGSGNDLVIGGTGDDEIYGEVGHDTLIGDQAYWSDELTTPRFVELLDETLPGDDRIYGGDGMDLILSGGGDDWNEGGNDNDAIFTGYGNDFLWGGEGRDRLTGGPDGDWIDGGFGGDFIYVDVFDTWATGFPQDTVIMGRMTTTGLLFSDDLIRNYGDAGAGDSAACNVIWSMERLLESGRASIVPVSMDGFWSGSSPILKNNVMEALLESGYDSVRWGGDGSSILRLSMDRVGVPRLIGIGDFIEQHWYDLLPLYN